VTAGIHPVHLKPDPRPPVAGEKFGEAILAGCYEPLPADDITLASSLVHRWADQHALGVAERWDLYAHLGLI